jgi:hypothetical protein
MLISTIRRDLDHTDRVQSGLYFPQRAFLPQLKIERVGKNSARECASSLFWSWVLEEIIDRLRIHYLKALVEATRLHSEALARGFERNQVSNERTRIAAEYNQVLNQHRAFQLLLELAEGSDRNSH